MADSEKVLKVEGLTKHYGGLCAVSSLNLEVKRGQVFGMLGPNGSGKTTTLGMLVHAVRPTAGRFWWFDQEFTHTSMSRIGAVLEGPTFYPYLTARQNLELVAMIKNVKQEGIARVLQQVGLLDRQNNLYKTYSLGMKQRLAVASALLHDPEVLILDEPTNGLDPMGIADIRKLIRQVALDGKTVILASHLLDEVQKVCSHFAVLKEGIILHSSPIQDMHEETETVEVRAEDVRLEHVLRDFSGASAVTKEDDTYQVTLISGIKGQDLNAFLAEQGISVSHLIIKQKNLEKYFLEILSKSK